MDSKICTICEVPIHEVNLKVVDGNHFHITCWKEFDNKIDNIIKDDLKKRKLTNWIKAIVISSVINFFLWWGFLEVVKYLINNWR